MRVLTHQLSFSLIIVVLVIAGYLTNSAHAQTTQATFRAATWGMSPDEVQTVERGTYLRSKSDARAGLDRIEAYFDVVLGKVGRVSYGFFEDRLVYGAYRFKLDEDDRAFSQTMGEQMRSTYGESKHVEVSEDGMTIRLHWSTPRTKVIGRFGPKSLDISLWDANHWERRTNRPTLDESR